MSQPRMRELRPEDRPGILRVCRETMLLGDPLPFPVQDLDRLLEVIVGYYLEEEPEGCRVVVDAEERVIGYMLVTCHPEAEERWTRRAALRLAWHWLRHWRHYDPLTRWYYRARLAEALEAVRNPGPALPVRAHWNLLPEARGRFGPFLVAWCQRHCRDQGLDCFGGEHTILASDHITNYERSRVQILRIIPHRTMSRLLGRPVWRLTLRIPVTPDRSTSTPR